MYYHKEIDEDPILSPLDLLYTAWSDQRPTVNQVITENYQALELYLAPLSQQDQHSVFQIICRIYSEKERLAFFEGLHVGVRLISELSEG